MIIVSPANHHVLNAQVLRMVNASLVYRFSETTQSSWMELHAWLNVLQGSFLKIINAKHALQAVQLVKLVTTSALHANEKLICLGLSAMLFVQLVTSQIKMKWYARAVILAAKVAKELAITIQSAPNVILNFIFIRDFASLTVQMVGKLTKPPTVLVVESYMKFLNQA